MEPAAPGNSVSALWVFIRWWPLRCAIYNCHLNLTKLSYADLDYSRFTVSACCTVDGGGHEAAAGHALQSLGDRCGAGSGQ